MAYLEKTANDVREIIAATHTNVEEKEMFGGLCFMVNGKMCVGVKTERLMFRINPDKFDEVVEKDGCRPMIMRGKALKDYVFVDTEILNTKKKLMYWINLALEYNEIAKPAKKKKG